MKAYYATGQRCMLDGVPIWRPKWWGKLGNDKEFKEATKLRINPAHYAGWHRMVIDGTPYRVAPHVAKWKPSNKAALCQGSDRFGLTMLPHPKGRLQYVPEQKLIDHYKLDTQWQRRWTLRKRLSAEYELNKFQFPPDLFVWARWEAKRLRARKALTT